MTRLAAALCALAFATAPSAAAQLGAAAVPASLACGPLQVTVLGQPPEQQVQFVRRTAVLATVPFEPEGTVVSVLCRAGVAEPSPAVLVSNYTGGMHCRYTVSV
jgi:hypothetical protein